MSKVIEKIRKQISSNKIILYMKGSPKYPECGFSSQAVKILMSYEVRFAYIDVLTHTDIRSELPNFSNWPTFPQLWINGKLIGGCDIMMDMHKRGKLKKLIEKNVNS